MTWVMYRRALFLATLLIGLPVIILAIPAITEYQLPASIPGITAENYPVVNGSTSTRPIGQLLLGCGLGIPGELRRTGTGELGVGFVFPLSASAQEVQRYRDFSISRARHEGTHQAYERLLGRVEVKGNPSQYIPPSGPNYLPKEADIILVARAPSPDELAAAKEMTNEYNYRPIARNIEFDVRPVALDAFVVLAHSNNPVSTISLDQLRDIYTGKATNWKDADGADATIKAYTRDRNSGSQELMELLVLQGRPGIVVQEAMLDSMGGPIDKVANEPAAIAYSVYYYAALMNPGTNVKLLGINGVLPTRETIANRTYPLVAEVYVVTRKGIPANSPAAILRDWLLSDDGQRLIGASGYIPIRDVSPRATAERK